MARRRRRKNPSTAGWIGITLLGLFVVVPVAMMVLANKTISDQKKDISDTLAHNRAIFEQSRRGTNVFNNPNRL